MTQGKVEICGVNTAKLPILSEKEKEALFARIKEGDEEEAEAEFFAKYALAPPPLIHNMVEDISPFSIMKKFDISYAAACYAYKYYNSWLQYGQREYTGYERKILSQFSIA